MSRLVDADTSSMTLALAGKFTPTEDMFTLAEHSGQLLAALFGRVRDALRPGTVAHDLSLVFELVAAIKTTSPERTRQLRQRYLAVIMDGLRAPGTGPLPGPPPAWPDITERWRSDDPPAPPVRRGEPARCAPTGPGRPRRSAGSPARRAPWNRRRGRRAPAARRPP